MLSYINNMLIMILFSGGGSTMGRGGGGGGTLPTGAAFVPVDARRSGTNPVSRCDH